jgi:hypothetical protein
MIAHFDFLLDFCFTEGLILPVSQQNELPSPQTLISAELAVFLAIL